MATQSARAQAGTDLSHSLSSFDLASRNVVVAAVSGGSDSTALLLLLKQHVEAYAPSTKIVAVTVDHGLRPESAAEAEAVSRFCTRKGIAHRTMRWSGAKPATGLQAAARLARYRLLVEAASVEGSDVIITGHTADDQAETVAMRAARGDGRGLAGMAPATLLDGKVWLLRPLLGSRRDDLRRLLAGAGESWIDDVSNADRRFERVRVRAHLHTPDLEAVARAGERRGSIGAAAADIIANHVGVASPGLVRIGRDLLAEQDQAAIYALRILLAQVGGMEQLPDFDRAEKLFASLPLAPFRVTLSRTVVDNRPDGIFLHRERRGLPAQQLVPANGIWDGRFRVAGPADGLLVIAPVGVERARKFDIKGIEAPARLVRDALAGEPMACGESSPLTAVPVLAPWARLLPSFDIAPAQALAALVGAPSLPASPFRGHIGRGA